MSFNLVVDTVFKDTITSQMFGANNIFLYNRISGQGGTFDEAVELLNVTNIRFPGGTVTELHFDVTNPNGTPLNVSAGQRYLTLNELLEFAQLTNRSVDIVLPTSRFYTGTMDHIGNNPRAIVQSYVEDTLHYVQLLITKGDMGPNALPDANIASIEIGNEYWGIGLSEKEYGAIVNIIVAQLKALFIEVLGPNATHPAILVQMGDPWGLQYTDRSGIYHHLSWNQKVQKANQEIISQITNPLSQAAIDGLVEHFYSGHLGSVIDQTGANFTKFIGVDYALWSSSGFANLDLHITEWNNSHKNSSQFGLKGASLLIAQMQAMLELGVDAAHAWPVQSATTDLAGNIGQTPRLTPSGAAFLLMSESIQGKRLATSNIAAGTLEVDVYVSESEAVLFASSRSDAPQNVKLKFHEFIRSFANVSGVKISVGEGISFNDESSSAVLHNFTMTEILESKFLNFHLLPYEVMRITFSDVTLQGLAGNDSITGSSADDSLFGGKGNDTIFGHGGDDLISGGIGLDILYGGQGNDTFLGGLGADTFFGGAGIDVVSYAAAIRGQNINMSDTFGTTDWGAGDTFSSIEIIIGSNHSDFIVGDSGMNTIYGGAGDDCLFGGLNADALYGGAGNDMLDGGNGADYLDGGAGDDLLIGGRGPDRFAHDGTTSSGTDWILDFSSSESDTLVFNGSGSDIDDFSIAAEFRARLWVTEESVLAVRHIPSGQDLWVLENGQNSITDVRIVIDNITYDLL